jgi:L-2,4-diaminobutyrate decarboxylase
MTGDNRDRIYSGARPGQVEKDLRPLVDFREEGIPLDELNTMVKERLLPHLMKYDLPAFHSMFNAFPEEGARLGAMVALDFNQGVTNWQVSPGGAVLEEMCCGALCRLFGFAEGSDATVMYCGTYANQQALYMALHRHAERAGFDFTEKGVCGFPDPAGLAIVTSEDAHFSLRHAARLLGLGEESLVTIGVDENRRIDIAMLKETMSRLGETRDVFCMVATAGTTSTGSVDPIADVAEISDETGVWLHVDGAYGLAYMLVPGWSHLFDGVARADSVSWDPHKQFSVPIPSSILFVRRGDEFNRMALFSSYFNRPDAEEPNPGIKSIPSTRPMTALPLVTSIRHLGLKGVVERLHSPLKVIGELAEYLKAEPDMDLCHTPDTGILCFRAIPGGSSENQLNQLQLKVYERMMNEGSRSIAIAQLDEKTVLRLVAVSPSVTIEAAKETIQKIREMAAEEAGL